MQWKQCSQNWARHTKRGGCHQARSSRRRPALALALALAAPAFFVAALPVAWLALGMTVALVGGTRVAWRGAEAEARRGVAAGAEDGQAMSRGSAVVWTVASRPMEPVRVPEELKDLRGQPAAKGAQLGELPPPALKPASSIQLTLKNHK